MVQPNNTLRTPKERYSEAQDKSGLNDLWKLFFLLFDTEFQPETRIRSNSIDQIFKEFKKPSKDSLSLPNFFLSKCKIENASYIGKSFGNFVVVRIQTLSCSDSWKLVIVDAFKMQVGCLVWRGFKFKTTALMRIGEAGIN